MPEIIYSGFRIYYQTNDKRIFLITLGKYTVPQLYTKGVILVNLKNKRIARITPMNILNEEVPVEVINFAKKLLGNGKIKQFRAPCFIKLKNKEVRK